MKYYLKVGIEHFGFGLIIPLSISWKLANGLSIADAALTEAVILITTALLEIPTGVVADKLGNKRALSVGAALQTLATVLLVIGGSLEVFVVSALLSGAGWAFSSGADEAYVHDDYLKDSSRYQRVFANATIVDETATVAGMLLSSALVFWQGGIRTPFVIAGLLLAMHTIYTLLILPQNTSPRPLQTKTNQSPSALGSIKSWKRTLLPLLPLLIALAIVYESGRVLWQPHLQNIGVDLASFGLIFALFKLTSIVGSMLARNRVFGTKDLIILFATMLVTLVAFGTNTVALSIISLLLFLATENYFRVYMSTVLNKAISHNRATMLSMASSIRNVLGGGLIFAVGLVAISSIQTALIILAICKVPAMLYLLFMYHRVRSSQNLSEESPDNLVV